MNSRPSAHSRPPSAPSPSDAPNPYSLSRLVRSADVHARSDARVVAVLHQNLEGSRSVVQGPHVEEGLHAAVLPAGLQPPGLDLPRVVGAGRPHGEAQVQEVACGGGRTRVRGGALVKGKMIQRRMKIQICK